jgi:hypothetical protein
MGRINLEPNLTNTFLNKVVAERAALLVINRSYTGSRQLSGLSLPAIEQWRGKVALPADHVLVKTLVRLGDVAQTLSNKSNESFAPLTPEVKDAIDKLMQQLAEQVKCLPQASSG